MGFQPGRHQVRRAVRINAPVQRVWQEFQGLGAWFGVGHQLDVFTPWLGGRVELSTEQSGLVRKFGGDSFGGDSIVWDEAAELFFENNWFDEQA